MDGFVPWPDEFARRYREAGYWAGVSIGDAFVEATRRFEDRVAVVDGDRRASYGELRRLVTRLEGHLVARGICGGERVVFQLPNRLEFVVAYFACLRVGAIPVCALPHHRHTEVAALAQIAGAKAWFIPDEIRGFDFRQMAAEVRKSVPSLTETWVLGEKAHGATASLQELLEEDAPAPRAGLDHVRPRSGDIAVLQLSGGTTGLPKLIPRTHDDYYYNSRGFCGPMSVDGTSILLLGIPLGHNLPLACPGLQGALGVGARVVLAPSLAPDVVLPLIERERVTYIPCVPAALIQWTEAGRGGQRDFSSLRSIYVGGQRLNAEPARAATGIFGPVVRQCYGTAEGLIGCTRAEDPPEYHLNYQARPMSPGDEIRVIDDDGRECKPGAPGELECRGPYTIRGYFRAEEHNKVAFAPDGFYRTGDVVELHPNGYFSILGRKKDLINRGGEKISAEDIENLILSHHVVQNVALVAIPDPVLGERACACVVLKEGTSLELGGLVAFLRTKQIAAYKLPERLEIFDKLPETGVGKVSKKDLRQAVAERMKETREPGTS